MKPTIDEDLIRQLANLVGKNSPSDCDTAAMTLLADSDSWAALDWDNLWDKYERVRAAMVAHEDARKDVVYNDEFDWWYREQRRLEFMELYLWEQIKTAA